MTKQEVLDKLTELYCICYDSSGVDMSDTDFDEGWIAMAGAISTAEDVAIKEINND